MASAGLLETLSAAFLSLLGGDTVQDNMEKAASDNTTVITDLGLVGGGDTYSASSPSLVAGKNKKATRNLLNSTSQHADLDSKVSENTKQVLSAKGMERPTVRGGNSAENDQTQDNREHKFSTQFQDSNARSIVNLENSSNTNVQSLASANSINEMSSGISFSRPYSPDINPVITGASTDTEYMKWMTDTLTQAIKNYHEDKNSKTTKDTDIKSPSHSEEQSNVNKSSSIQNLLETSEGQEPLGDIPPPPSSFDEASSDGFPPPPPPEFNITKLNTSKSEISDSETPRERAVTQYENTAAGKLSEHGVSISSTGVVGKLLETTFKTLKVRDRTKFLSNLAKQTDKGIEKIFGSLESLQNQIIKKAFPIYSKTYEDLNAGEKLFVDDVVNAVKGLFLSSFVQGSKINLENMIASAKDKAIDQGLSRIVKVSNFSEAAMGDIKSLLGQVIKETSYFIEHSDNLRNKVLAEMKTAFIVYFDNHADFKIPSYIDGKGDTRLDREAAIINVLPKIFKLAQEMTLLPQDHIIPKAAVAKQEELDDSRVANLLAGKLGKSKTPPTQDDLKLLEEIKSAFYEKFERTLLEIPQDQSVEDFLADKNPLNIKLQEFIDLSPENFKQKLETSIKSASSGLKVRGIEVTANKFLQDMFKAEISSETGFSRSGKLNRDALRQTVLTPVEYFEKIATTSSDDVQYVDPNNNKNKVIGTAALSLAHHIVATHNAMKVHRPKLQPKTTITAPVHVNAVSTSLQGLVALFNPLLNINDVSAKVVDPNATTGLKTLLERDGITGVSDSVAEELLKLKGTTVNSVFVRNFIKKIDGKLFGTENPENLVKQIFQNIGINNPNSSILRALTKAISESLRKDAFAKVLTNKMPNTFDSSKLESFEDALFSQIDSGIKVASQIGVKIQDLKIAFRTIIRNIGNSITKDQKQKLLTNVLYKILLKHETNPENYKLPKTESGALDSTEFFNMLVPEVNKAFVQLGMGAQGPLKLIEKEVEENLDFSPTLPTLERSVYDILMDSETGTDDDRRRKLAIVKSEDLLRRVASRISGTTIENVTLTPKIMEQVKIYLKDRMKFLTDEFSRKLVAKRVLELDETPTAIVTELKSGGFRYKVFGKSFDASLLDTTGKGTKENQVVTVTEGDILLALPDLWKRAQILRAKDLADKAAAEKLKLNNEAMKPRLEDLLVGKLDALEELLKEEIQQADSNNTQPSTAKLKAKYTLSDLEKRQKDAKTKGDENMKEHNWKMKLQPVSKDPNQII
ncbi:hypothetical protein Bealeia1_00892 [Candidatus Bealeia paramacronuclearis]|uniref:Uncharacterized protein n=1 Tax=Candidatus Bealeia paramacronuclearis TaxID=1921001 RepID=A0ABZ2C3S5_9PROT|nr:hypothetical protein [Candidatus Bealeia paramacronuclearis]